MLLFIKTHSSLELLILSFFFKKYAHHNVKAKYNLKLYKIVFVLCVCIPFGRLGLKLNVFSFLIYFQTGSLIGSIAHPFV